MNKEFILPVQFKEETLRFPARLLNYRYGYKLEIEIEGTKLLFEPDEEGNWRVLLSYEELQSEKKFNPELLKRIAEAIEEITK